MNYNVKIIATETLQVSATDRVEAEKLATEAFKRYLQDKKNPCGISNIDFAIQSIEPVSVSHRLSFVAVVNLFREINKAGLQPISAYIVFNADNWDKAYSQESRTYEISSNNKYFQAGMNGSSIFGSCLDGTDQNIRLDCYLSGECAWRIDYCYIPEDVYDKVITMLADKYCN